MSLKPIAPGQRHGNRSYIFRGTVAGARHEIRSDLPAGTAAHVLRAIAERLERGIWAEHEQSRIPGRGETVTFRRAGEAYIAWRDPGVADIKRIERLYPILGDMSVSDIIHADLVAAATKIMRPGALASSRNREIIRPAAAILHYAERQGWCRWLRLPGFKEPAPRPRALSDEAAATLIATAPAGPKRLLLLWLFREGTRISDTLRINWDDIDLARRTVQLHISKTDEHKEKPLHGDVLAELRLMPRQARQGRLFPWETKSGVYKWWRPLAVAAGIPGATPHMARHTLGRQLNESGAGLRTIMGALDHRDPKSSMRYQSAELELVRAALAKIGRKRA